MAMVNIPRYRDDPNYRYKMPRLRSKIEGRGNGIKTNIPNMGDIARALKRPPMYPTKFFGCELGTTVKFEEAEEKALVNGQHHEADLIVILDKFIEMYVLCQSCQLPEVDIAVKKKMLVGKCNACGYIGNLDMIHKAATYMIRNPPDSATSTLGKKKKIKDEKRPEKPVRTTVVSDSDEKRDKKVKKDKNKSKKDKGDSEGEGSGDQESAVTNQINESSIDSTCKEEEKKKKSIKTNCEQLIQHESLTYTSPELSHVIERLLEYVKSNEGLTPSDLSQELRILQVAQDFDSKCRMYVVFNTFFEDEITRELIIQKIPYINEVLDRSVTKLDFLEAFDYFCYTKKATSLSQLPYFLQALYVEHVLDPDDILSYYGRASEDSIFMECKDAARPFLDWLRDNNSGDEESDGEESTEEHVLDASDSKATEDSTKPIDNGDEFFGEDDVDFHDARETDDVITS